MRYRFSDKGRVGAVSFALFCVSLILTAYTSKHPRTASLGHQAVAEAVRPFEVFTHGTYSKIISIWDGYFNLIGVTHENSTLRARLATLESVNAHLEEIEKENIQLRGLLNISQSVDRRFVSASIIGYDPSGWVQAVTLNRGSNHGLEIGLPVIEGNGVVGQVIAVSPNTARVLLIIDRSSGVDVLIQENRARGILEGIGESVCEYRYVTDTDEVTVGDKVVTSGLDGVFPKGLVVGVVTKVAGSGGLFKSVEVTPSVKFTKLENVLVLLKGGA